MATWWLLLSVLSFIGDGQDYFVIIAAVNSPIDRLSIIQTQALYLGKLTHLGGTTIRPVQLKKGNPLRARFETKVFKKSVDLDDYWLVSRLQGGPRQPLSVRGWGLVVAYVSRNPGYIGYVPAEKTAELAHHRVKIIPISNH